MTFPDTLQTYAQLQPGEQVEFIHQVKVGMNSWTSATTGIVVHKERRRHGLHFRRNNDDKVFSDILILRREDGELSTFTLDEFCTLRKVAAEGID